MDIKELIKLLGFSLESQNESGSFGDFVSTYISPYFRLRIVGDRGQRRIDLAFNDQPQEWFDLGLVRSCLGFTEDETAPLSFEDCVSFLKIYFSQIQIFFQVNNALQKRSRLYAKRNERAKKMFPGKF